MLKLTQKTFIDKSTGQPVAFVEAVLHNEGYTYKLSFDKDTKRRINILYRNLGFRCGPLAEGETVPDKVVEI